MTLTGEEAGEGTPVVLLHGLTATRRYVLHGSRSLERSPRRVIAYDARGHGESAAAESPENYGYEQLVDDLRAVLDGREVARAVLVGNSMGAHTAVAAALDDSDRFEALVLVTPGYPGHPVDSDDAADWDRLAAGLRLGGVDGFLDAYDPDVDARYRETVETFTRQRLERHRDLQAVADAMTVVPRSPAFDGLEALGAIGVPCLVVGSRDDADPGHPLAVAEAWVEHLPDAELAVEDEGESPLAWQGGQLSKRIAEFLGTRDAG